MEVISIALFDEVEMKKAHPCSSRTKRFQITRVGADVKIRCLGCGKVMMLDRDTFNHKLKRVIAHHENLISLEPTK